MSCVPVSLALRDAVDIAAGKTSRAEPLPPPPVTTSDLSTGAKSTKNTKRKIRKVTTKALSLSQLTERSSDSEADYIPHDDVTFTDTRAAPVRYSDDERPSTPSFSQTSQQDEKTLVPRTYAVNPVIFQTILRFLHLNLGCIPRKLYIREKSANSHIPFDDILALISGYLKLPAHVVSALMPQLKTIFHTDAFSFACVHDDPNVLVYSTLLGVDTRIPNYLDPVPSSKRMCKRRTVEREPPLKKVRRKKPFTTDFGQFLQYF
ncbi:hypothetical protein RCL1_004542 [Eukaryota sp. TZLM3-RCL]